MSARATSTVRSLARVPRRALMYAALALCVPLPALAGAGDGSGGLAVETALEGCAVKTDLVCEVSASFERLPDADRYTLRVIDPGGGERDFGTVAGAGAGRAAATVPVPYSGSGTYTVVVSAWANADEEDELVEDGQDSSEDSEGSEEPEEGDGDGSGG